MAIRCNGTGSAVVQRENSPPKAIEEWNGGKKKTRKAENAKIKKMGEKEREENREKQKERKEARPYKIIPKFTSIHFLAGIMAITALISMLSKLQAYCFYKKNVKH